MIVCIMCPVMSLVATLLFQEPSFGTWVHTWGCNFPMALCWQTAVSYTHLDVYKRQALYRPDGSLMPVVQADIDEGPAHARHAMSMVAARCV